MDFAVLAVSSVFKNLDRTSRNLDLNAAELDSSSRSLKSESGEMPTLLSSGFAASVQYSSHGVLTSVTSLPSATLGECKTLGSMTKNEWRLETVECAGIEASFVSEEYPESPTGCAFSEFAKDVA